MSLYTFYRVSTSKKQRQPLCLTILALVARKKIAHFMTKREPDAKAERKNAPVEASTADPINIYLLLISILHTSMCVDIDTKRPHAHRRS